jgi:hypothetical protein
MSLPQHPEEKQESGVQVISERVQKGRVAGIGGCEVQLAAVGDIRHLPHFLSNCSSEEENEGEIRSIPSNMSVLFFYSLTLFRSSRVPKQ